MILTILAAFDALPQERLFTYFEKKLLTLSKLCRDNLSNAMAKLNKHFPLPEYTPEKEKEFQAELLGNNSTLHKAITAAATEVENAIKTAEQVCQNMGMEISELLQGDQTLALSRVADGRQALATSTILRILSCKAAENSSAALLPSLKAMFEYMEGRSIILPEGIQTRADELEKRLVAASKKK